MKNWTLIFKLQSPSTVPAALTLAMLSPLLSASSAEAAAYDGGNSRINDTLEEVTVIARKREESLQQVPVAVTAFTGDNMAARGIVDVSQIADFTPNVQIDFTAPITGSSNAATIFIRGVGQTDFLMSIDPGVGVYVDGVYLARSMGSVLDLLDIERIEVLRGPQGTLFGKNTIGGAINVTTERPGPELEGTAELTVGRFDKLDFKGSINVPLVDDTLFLRLSGASQNSDGWGERADGLELGDENTDVYRGTLLWQATDNLDLQLSVDGTDTKEGSPVSTLLFVDPAASLSGLYNGFVANGPAEVFDPRYIVASPDAGGVLHQGTDPMGSEYEHLGASMVINWDMGNYSIKSIAAYREMDVAFGNDADHSPLPILSTSTTMEHEQFSFELNVSGSAMDDMLDWLVGGYYFTEEGSNDTDALITLGLFGNPGLQAFALSLPPGPDQGQLLAIAGAGTAAAGINTVDNESFAGFIHASYHLFSQFTLTGGIRYTYEDKKAFNSSNFKDLADTLPPGVPLPPPFFVLSNPNWQDSFENVSPHINLQYVWNDDVMGYLSYSGGFKSGGVGERYRIPRLAPVAFEPETVDSYELGVKADLLGKRLRINAAAFYMDYTDIQVSTVLDVEPLTFNAAEAEIKGLEFEFVVLPAAGLTLTGGFGYIDASYTDLDPGVLIGINNDFVDTPQWSATVAAEYVYPVVDAQELTFRADYSYRADVANDAMNTPELIQESFGILNAGLTYDFLAKGVSLTLYGRNLTDEEYLVSGWAEVGALGLVEGTWGRPREWGLMLRVDF